MLMHFLLAIENKSLNKYCSIIRPTKIDCVFPMAERPIPVTPDRTFSYDMWRIMEVFYSFSDWPMSIWTK